VTDQNQKTTTYSYDDADSADRGDRTRPTTLRSMPTKSNLTSTTDANNHTKYVLRGHADGHTGELIEFDYGDAVLLFHKFSLISSGEKALLGMQTAFCCPCAS